MMESTIPGDAHGVISSKRVEGAAVGVPMSTSSPDPPAGGPASSQDGWILRFVEVVCSLDPTASGEQAREVARLAWCSAAHLDPQQAAMHFSRGHSTSPMRRDEPGK